MANVIHATKKDFMDIVGKEGVVFVDFYANWCGPCKMLAPELEKLATLYEGRAKVLKIDVDKETDLANQYHVQSIPTMIVFKNDEIKAKELGYRPLSVLKAMIEECL